MSGWKDSIAYYGVSLRSSTIASYESRSDPRTRDEVRHYVINGVEQDGTFTVKVPYEVEQRRIVRTRTEVEVYECRGVLREAAMAAKTSAATMDADTGDTVTQEVTAARSNEADGWTVTKTLTTVKVMREAWKDYAGEET